MSAATILKIIGVSLAIVVVLFLLGVFELYSQVGRYRAYWQKNNQKPAAQNEILYVALGDSTAQGIGASSPKKSYPGLLKTDIEKRQDKPVRLVNLSKSGAKVKDVLNDQLPEFAKLNAPKNSIVTIEIGANDMLTFNDAKFESEIDDLMSRLPSQTIISDIPYFGESRFKKYEPNVEKANTIMYRLAEKHNFILAPLHDKMKSNGGVKTFAIDWFHPSNSAYRQNWEPVFLERIKL